MLSPRVRLVLSARGFACGTVRCREFYRWDEVAWFTVAEFAHHNLVVFTFAADYRGQERARRINQDCGGFDRFLSDSYGLRAAALAELLERRRLRHMRVASRGLAS
jgi:hypothetical protein